MAKKRQMHKKQKQSKIKPYWTRFSDWHKKAKERRHNGAAKHDIVPEECEECVCKNCGYTFRGHNCPNCGQSAKTQRITIKTALNNLVVTLIGGDSVFLRTCGHLLYRPGHMIRDFICGKRTRYFRPVQMLLCLVTVYALLSLIFKDNLSLNGFSNVEIDSANMSDTFVKAQQTLFDFLSNTVAYSLVFAFINVFPYKLLFHRDKMTWPDGERRSLNTAEFFCMLVYLACLLIICDYILAPFYWIPGAEKIIKTIGLLYSIFIPIWICKQLFEISWWKSIWKNIIVYIITLTAMIFLLILYFGIYYGIAEVVK